MPPPRRATWYAEHIENSLNVEGHVFELLDNAQVPANVLYALDSPNLTLGSQPVHFLSSSFWAVSSARYRPYSLFPSAAAAATTCSLVSHPLAQAISSKQATL